MCPRTFDALEHFPADASECAGSSAPACRERDRVSIQGPYQYDRRPLLTRGNFELSLDVQIFRVGHSEFSPLWRNGYWRFRCKSALMKFWQSGTERAGFGRGEGIRRFRRVLWRFYSAWRRRYLRPEALLPIWCVMMLSPQAPPQSPGVS